MEKEKYLEPEMEVVAFETEDVIITSDPSNQGGAIELPDQEF